MRLSFYATDELFKSCGELFLVVTLNIYGYTLSEVKKRNNIEDKGGTKVFGEGDSRLNRRHN